MKVDFSFNVMQRESLRGMLVNPAASMNRSVVVGGKSVRRDTLAISGQGRNNSMIETLMNQRKNMVKQRDKLISDTLENGGTKDDIKAMLDVFEEELAALDEQVKAFRTQQAQLQIKQMVLKKPEGQEPKSDLEAENQRIAKMQTVERELEQAERLSYMKDKSEAEAAILEYQIERDGGLSKVETSEGIQELSDINITSKQEKVNGLYDKADEYAMMLGDKLVEIADRLEDLQRPGYIRDAEAAEEEEAVAETPAEEAPAEEASADTATTEE